ncbi:hypothetical protein KR200_006217 [Drosophila serrata]|nr:hypothetical protein KR200_006217 [Drosophila serrata]
MRFSAIQIFVSLVGLLIRQEALAQFLEPNCGLTGVVDRIVDGNNARHGQFPWMAYIYQNENDFTCGGSLIHKRFVLTAAHCIVNDEYLTVRLGEYFTESRADSSIVYRVTMALRNRLYTKAEHINDIGILRLERDVQYNANIRPICIMTDSRRVPYVGSYTASGWGKTANSRTSAVLQMIELQDIDENRCYDHMGLQLGPGQICAAHPTGDTCLGDSGGPLVHSVNVDGTPRYVQFGIVSYGVSACIGPGVYTRVHYYVDWILRAVQYGLTH